MRTLFCFLSIFLLVFFPLFAQTSASGGMRTFDGIFPNLSASVRQAVFSHEGYYRSSEKVPPSALIGSGHNAIASRIIDAVFITQPSVIIESMQVIPGEAGKYSLLDVYNALGKIQGLKGRLYHSFTRNEDVPLFEEVTRIESAKKNVPIADPPPALKIPAAETIYMRLKDVNFGNSYYRGDIFLEEYGLRYSLSNNKNLTYFLIPVIKEEKFIAQLYFEPISEGMLIYGLAGADVSDFVSSRIDMASAINKRLAVIISWVIEGITQQ